ELLLLDLPARRIRLHLRIQFIQTPCSRPIQASIIDPNIFSLPPFPLNHFPSQPPETPPLDCYRGAVGVPMATLKQIEANRCNAQHSTGPRTAQGKAISRT